MIFLSALLAFVINASGVPVNTCEASWLDAPRFGEVLSAELSTLSEAERVGTALAIDECTDAAVTLHVNDSAGTRERTISIEGVPAEAKMRTVAIALGELVKERPLETAAGEPPSPAVSTESEAAASGEAQPLAPMPVVDTEPPSKIEKTVEPNRRDRLRFALGVYFRTFPLADAYVPELRFGLRPGKWRFELGGYAWGWKEAIGTVYLTAVTLTVGRSLWQYTGRVAMSLDALVELGAVIAFGKATTDQVKETPKVNMLAGAHLGWRIAPGRDLRVTPAFHLEVGWVRGLNVYAADVFVAGFEGLSAAAGVRTCW